MLPIHKIIYFEIFCKEKIERINEPEIMNDLEQVQSYVKAYEWGGPTSALQLHHLKELSYLIKSGDRIVDLACGPGPLLLELAVLFPECQFIGVDMAPLMLNHLESSAKTKNLKNIRTMQADIRNLQSSDLGGPVDLVISTSAFHHLPEPKDLDIVFNTISKILKSAGGFYIFDFGFLNSNRTKNILVNDLRKKAPPLTVQDYEVSLNACFPLSTILDSAARVLPRPFLFVQSMFVDFFYFLQSPRRTHPSDELNTQLKNIWNSLSLDIKMEHLTLRFMRVRKNIK